MITALNVNCTFTFRIFFVVVDFFFAIDATTATLLLLNTEEQQVNTETEMTASVFGSKDTVFFDRQCSSLLLAEF